MLTQEDSAKERDKVSITLNPVWIRFIKYCERIQYGEIAKLKIQDGLPIAIEVATKKIKFT